MGYSWLPPYHRWKISVCQNQNACCPHSKPHASLGSVSFVPVLTDPIDAAAPVRYRCGGVGQARWSPPLSVQFPPRVVGGRGGTPTKQPPLELGERVGVRRHIIPRTAEGPIQCTPEAVTGVGLWNGSPPKQDRNERRMVRAPLQQKESVSTRSVSTHRHERRSEFPGVFQHGFQGSNLRVAARVPTRLRSNGLCHLGTRLFDEVDQQIP